MTSSKLSHIERIRNIYNETIESGDKVQIKDIEDIDYYSLLCKATSLNKIHKMFNFNMCLFNCEFEGEDSIIIIFSVPFSLKKVDSEDKKHPSEKVMDVLKIMEECFINLDYVSFKEVKEDKFSYVTFIKKIKENEE